MRSDRVLTDQDVIDILNCDASNPDLGKRYGVSKETIRQIRNGTIYSDAAPGVARWTKGSGGARIGASCYSCVNWRGGRTWDESNPGRCLFGFPDPWSEGARFARFCLCYQYQPKGAAA